jgi:hypothetical protein
MGIVLGAVIGKSQQAQKQDLRSATSVSGVVVVVTFSLSSGTV